MFDNGKIWIQEALKNLLVQMCIRKDYLENYEAYQSSLNLRLQHNPMPLQLDGFLE